MKEKQTTKERFEEKFDFGIVFGKNSKASMSMLAFIEQEKDLAIKEREKELIEAIKK